MRNYRALHRTTARLPRHDETELINPRVHGEAFDLLRAYHVTDWTDSNGWHVIIPTSRLAEIEGAENTQREGA